MLLLDVVSDYWETQATHVVRSLRGSIICGTLFGRQCTHRDGPTLSSERRESHAMQHLGRHCTRRDGPSLSSERRESHAMHVLYDILCANFDEYIAAAAACMTVKAR